MYPKTKRIFLLLPFLALSFFQHSEFLSLDIQGIHAWRQSATMWNIRIFASCLAKFLIMQWGIGLAQRILGEKIEVVRVFVFLIGIFTILGIFFIVNFITGDWRTGLLTAIFFQYSPVFYYYTINPLPDAFAFCSSVWYIFFIIQYYLFKRESKYLLSASIFLCLATLAKLPYLMLSIISISFFIKDIRQLGFDKRSLYPAIFQLIGIIPAIGLCQLGGIVEYLLVYSQKDYSQKEMV